MSDSNTPRNPGDETLENSTPQEVSTTLAVESVETIGQEATDIPVNLPAQGTTQSISAQAGQRLQLNFDATQAAAAVDGQNLILNFDIDQDGTPESSIVFEGLAGDFADGEAPVLVIDGAEVAAGQLINLVLAQAGELPLETAAGAGAGPTGGGGSTYNDNLGGIIDLLNAQGVIDPTELEFGLLEGLEDITDLAGGSFQLSFLTVTTDIPDDGGEGGEDGGNENFVSGSFAGGFEDWQPNQHLGNYDEFPMQVVFTFVPEDDEVMTSVVINALPAGATLFIGGSGSGDIYTGPFPVTVLPTDFDDVYILPPEHSDADILVSATANIVDPSSGDTAALPASATAIVDAAADLPSFEEGGGSLNPEDAYVGYYDMSQGQGNSTQLPSISASGANAVNVFDLSPGELAGLDVLIVQNPSNGNFGSEYLSSLANIQAAVANGLVLIINDRFVANAESILPDSGGFNILRDFANGSSIDVGDPSSVLVTAGTATPTDDITDSNLDGGNSSNHGYAVVSSLGDAEILLTNGNDDQAVAFSYEFGAGTVYYSSIPLDFYLGGSGPAGVGDNFREIYAENLVDYAISQAGGSAEIEDIKINEEGSERVSETGSKEDFVNPDIEIPVSVTFPDYADDSEVHELVLDGVPKDWGIREIEGATIWQVDGDDVYLVSFDDGGEGGEGGESSEPILTLVTDPSDLPAALQFAITDDDPTDGDDPFQPLEDEVPGDGYVRYIIDVSENVDAENDDVNDGENFDEGVDGSGSLTTNVIFDPNDWTDDRLANGESHDDGPAEISIRAVATEVGNPTSGAELTDPDGTPVDENNQAITEAVSLEVSVCEDAPELAPVSLVHDETPGIINDNDIGGDDDVEIDVPTAVEDSFDRLNGDDIPDGPVLTIIDDGGENGGKPDPRPRPPISQDELPDVIGQAEQTVYYDLFTDGSNDEDNLSDQANDNPPTDAQEKIEFDLGSFALSGLSSAGSPVHLYQDPGDTQVVWGLNDDNEVVFALHITGDLLDGDNTGTLTFVQYAPIDHPIAGDGAEGSHDEPVSFTLGYRVTDDEGDYGVEEVTITVQDDGPSIDLFRSDPGAMLVLDESLGDGGEGDLNAADEENPNADLGAIGYAEISGVDLFDLVVDPGTDGEKSRVFTLTLTGGATGLTDTLSDDPVVLSMDGTDIVGMAGADEVFRITVDPVTGGVTVNQYRALVHDDDSDHDESDTPEIMASGLVDLTVTVTDGDDDTDSDSIELGSLIKFEDDGPVVDINLQRGAMLVLDESLGGEGAEGDPNAGDELNPNADDDAIGYAEIEGGSLFNLTSDPGTDGEDSTVFTFDLMAGPSGLTDTESGDPVALSMDGDDVVGTADGEEVFRITVDEDTGDVTVNQYRALAHDDVNDHDEFSSPEIMNSNLLKLTVTVTDGDEDTASDSIDLGSVIKFEDDGPWIKHIHNNDDDLEEWDLTRGDHKDTVTGRVHASFGTDGGKFTDLEFHQVTDPDGTAGDAVPPGFDGTLTSGGVPITFAPATLIGNTITLVGTAGTDDVIMVQMNQFSGNYKITLLGPIDHPDQKGNTQIGGRDQLRLAFTSTVTDGDGDTDSADFTVRVKDDGPHVHGEWAGHLHEDDLHQNGSEMVTGYINGDFGGDGPGSTQITDLLYVRDPEHNDGTPYPDFTSGGEPITFGSPTLIGGMMVLTGSANTGPGGSPETIITLSVDPITKYYEIELHKAVDHPDEDRLGYSDELEPYFRIAITDADGDVATAKLHFHITDDGPVISGKEYIMVDETDLDPGSSITASGQFDVFDYGADGPKEDNPGTRPDEALCIVLNTDGLTTSEDDLPVTTSQVGNVLTGWAGGEVVFTFTVDPDGSYEYEQFIALEHPNPNNHDEPLGLSFGVKIVDGDMDRDWGSVNVTVKDDGPRLDLTNERGAMLVLDESVGFDVSDPNADDETHPLADPSAIGFAAIRGDSFFDIFVDAGADGEKSRVFSLSLARGPSGLTDTLSGDPVVLIPDGGDIVGMADGSEVFRISVDPDTGAVFVNQYRALVHDNPADHDESATPEIMSAGLVGLTATITDGDNDTASDTIELGNRIKFEDDGPTVVITHETNSMLVLDETLGSGVPGDVNAPDETHPDAHPDAIGYSAIDGDDLFMVDVDPGTDGLLSQVYTLTLMGGPSGLADSMNGLDVVLSMDGGDIVGMAGGDEVFRISVDPVTGGVEVNQFRALEHNDPTDPDEASSPEIMQSGRVKLTVTVTDGDDDSASSSMELGRLIKFEDDGPQAVDDKEFVDESDSVDQPQNIGIVMDFSGSVTDPDLATEIASVKTFVETLFLSGATVSVTLVAFGADAATIGTFTDFASAEAALDGTSRGIVNSGATNFEAAMEELFSDAGGDFANIPGSNNEVFFLSDGNRNAGDEPLSDVDIVLDDGGKADLIDGDIGFTAIGIGGSISPSTFVDFFDGGVVDNVGEVISSATFEDLADILVGTIGLGSSVTGNVVTNDDAGTDGLDRICSIDVDGETFSVDEFGVLSGPTTGTPSASYDDGSKLLTVTTDKGVLEIYLDDAGGDAAGDYTYTASPAVPHGAPGSPTDDVVEDVFTYAIVDNDGDKASADLKICIHDGEPEAVDDKVVTIADTASVPQNVGVVMDFSGSVSNGDLATEIAGVKTFVQTLFGSGASVSVTLVAFGATAATLGTFTDLASAEAALDGTSRGIINSGSTNFEAAMEELFANGAGNGDFDHIPGSNNEIFFLSDGNRNSGASALSSGSVVLADGGKADLLSGDIELTAIGIGGSISPSTFVSFFDGGVVPNTGEVLLATDFEALAETLLSTISLGAIASGNVLTNDDAGPDGFGAPVAITEVEHDGVVHTDASDGSADGFIEFTTAEGGTFSINTETGAYEYVSGVVDTDFEETFTYTMVDGDGDPSSADLEICVKAPEPIVAHDDVVLTNITFGDIDIPDTALLYNDETNPSTSLTDADNPVNGTVNDGVNIVTFTPDSIPISSLGFGSGTVVQDIAEREFSSDGYIYHDHFFYDELHGSDLNSQRDTSGSNQSTQLGRSNWVRDGSTPSNEVVHLIDIHGRIKDARDNSNYKFDRDSYQVALLSGETFSLESFTGHSNLKVVLYSPGGSVLDSNFNPGELYTAPSSGNYYIRVESTDGISNDSDRSRSYEAELSIESTDLVSPEDGAFDYTISDTLTTDVADVSVKYQDGSTITGTDDGEILVGGDDDDTLVGNGGNDTLIGGAGSDTLTGGAGSDLFLFYGQNVGVDVDTVKDYDKAEGDILDVSDLITFTDGTGDVVADFVRATETGSGTSLEVSNDGVTYTEVAVLEGVVATDILTVILDDDEVMVTVVL
ncbi:MAG: DUF5801 repeats-in-toxin domain-containing protein [Halopseudomonas aestusnigri]